MLLTVKIVPRSSKNQIVGKMGDGKIKIKLTAPPVEGKANHSLIEVLSDHFKVSKNKIKIVRGRTTTTKVVEIST